MNNIYSLNEEYINPCPVAYKKYQNLNLNKTCHIIKLSTIYIN